MELHASVIRRGAATSVKRRGGRLRAKQLMAAAESRETGLRGRLRWPTSGGMDRDDLARRPSATSAGCSRCSTRGPTREDWVFVAVGGVPAGVAPLMTFREAEALTCIVTRGGGAAGGLAEAPVFRRITLGVAPASRRSG